MKPSCLRITGLLFAFLTSAQPILADVESARLQIREITTTDPGVVKILVAASDEQQHSLNGLGRANFIVRLDRNDVPQFTLETAAESNQPLSVLLAIDVSGSMGGPPIQAAKRAAGAFLDQLGPRDFCALVTFGSRVKLQQEYTSDKGAVKEAVNALSAHDNKTYLYQAIFEAVDHAGAAPTSRVAIVFLTDGKDEGSPLSIADATTKASNSGIPIYTLGFGAHADFKWLRRLATLSHGSFYAAPGPEELMRAYLSLGEQLKNGYLISFALPDQTTRDHELTVGLEYRGSHLSASRHFSWDKGVSTEKAAGGRSTARWGLVLIGFMGLFAVFALGFVLLKRYRRLRSPEFAPTIVPPRVWLEVVGGADAGQKFLLVGKETTIGRALGPSQVALKNDPLVGKQHARIRLNESGHYVIEDLNSKNGVSVNGIKMAEPVTLQPQDRIMIGLSELLFVDQR